jgi:hypothetical protein
VYPLPALSDVATTPVHASLAHIADNSMFLNHFQAHKKNQEFITRCAWSLILDSVKVKIVREAKPKKDGKKVLRAGSFHKQGRSAVGFRWSKVW